MEAIVEDAFMSEDKVGGSAQPCIVFISTLVATPAELVIKDSVTFVKYNGKSSS